MVNTIAVVLLGTVASAWDIRTRRIPNALTLSAPIVALVVHLSLDGTSGGMSTLDMPFSLVDESARFLGPERHRHVADRAEAIVVAAERAHRAVQRTRTRPEDRGIQAVGELVIGERRQDQLHLEAEQVQAVRPLARVERAEPVPAALARVQQTRLELRHRLGVALALREEVAAPLQCFGDDRQLSLF